MTAGSSMVAISSIRPAHCGQRRTSRSKARRISAAHVQERDRAAPQPSASALPMSSGEPVAGAVGTIRRGTQKIVQVLADDGVEHACLGMAGSVHRMIAGHGPR